MADLRGGGDGDATVGDVGDFPGDHGDTVNDGADTGTQSTSSTVVGDGGDVGVGIEVDGLVSTVVTGHVALATVDAHLVVHQGNHLRF